jgi:catechol 2,3-dioxygenase-like lactoylglutathione lyase family enzyme
MPDVSFVLVYVDDVSRSEAFYAAVLARPAIESSPTFAMLPAGAGLRLGLWRRDGSDRPRAAAPAARSPSPQAAKPRSTLSAAWRARGVAIAEEPTSMDFGYTFVGLDPDGQRLRVFAPSD